MIKAGPEHQEYKSGSESNEFISWPACQVDRRATMRGDYLRGRASRRFARTLLRLFVTRFLVSAASNT